MFPYCLEHFLKHKQAEITTTEDNVKPRKTQSVERVLNRAFTQVLFNGRQKIEATDVFLSMMAEKRSYAFYYIQQAGIDKDKLTAGYNAPDKIEIEDTDVDYMIDETEYEITKPMLETIINKFLKVDSRFKFMSLMSEIDEDYGGFDNLIEMYLPNDTSAQNNWKKQLQQYKNGIYAN